MPDGVVAATTTTHTTATAAADERHKREEAERRAKRKANKSSKSEAQLEKERKGKQYRQEILKRHHVGASGAAVSSSSNKRQKTSTSSSSAKQQQQQRGKPPETIQGGPKPTKSAFQELFAISRAQGFQVEFKFRNAPPRPPVGPCFIGQSLDMVLVKNSRQYKIQNAVEAAHKWQLHSEPDLGVPLAPSAMDLKSYDTTISNNANKESSEQSSQQLHPDDDAILNWTGSMGDTAAEEWKKQRERQRVEARLQSTTGGGVGPLSPLAAASPATAATAATVRQQSKNRNKKNKFSRVLQEEMQTWMKKTTYLSNDYSRKVHDFKSLAQTKNQLASDLDQKQVDMEKRRTVKAITALFEETTTNNNSNKLVHPTNKKLRPKHVLSVLPDTSINWGRAFTHLVIDKPPTNLPTDHYKVSDLSSRDGVFVYNVEKKSSNARMTCSVMVPKKKKKKKDDKEEVQQQQQQPATEEESTKDGKYHNNEFQPVQNYDLDVIPLKEEDSPHMHFCFWLDRKNKVATYLPVASRVQLSTGRPATSSSQQQEAAPTRKVQRRELSESERQELEERLAEIDADMSEKHHDNVTAGLATTSNTKKNVSFSGSSNNDPNNNNNNKNTNDNDDKAGAASKKGDDAGDDDDNDGEGEDDFGDDDDSDDDEEEEVFGGGTSKTIVAEL